MLNTERYIRYIIRNVVLSASTQHMLQQLRDLDMISRMVSLDTRLHDLQDEIQQKLEMYNKTYRDNIELLVPHFNNWYIMLKSKYTELIN